MEEHDIFLSYLRVTQHMSQQFRTHFGRLNLTFSAGSGPHGAGRGRAGTHQHAGRAYRQRKQHGLGHRGPAGETGPCPAAAQRDRPAGDLCLRDREIPAIAPPGRHRRRGLFPFPDERYDAGGPGSGGRSAEEAGMRPSRFRRTGNKKVPGTVFFRGKSCYNICIL